MRRLRSALIIGSGVAGESRIWQASPPGTGVIFAAFLANTTNIQAIYASFAIGYNRNSPRTSRSMIYPWE